VNTVAGSVQDYVVHFTLHGKEVYPSDGITRNNGIAYLDGSYPKQ
jgi:hypothetical protein